jgi:hypothetical protein
MSAKAAYLVQFRKDYVELFSESSSGAFDFAELFSGGEALAKAKAMAHELVEGSGEVELNFRNCFGKLPLYEAELSHPTVRRLGAPGAPEEEILAFLYRYPAFRQAQLRGDFIEAGRAMGRSGKLKRFRPLLRYLAERDLFLIFATYWLCDFDSNKVAILAELFGGRNPDTASDIWTELYDFARPGIESRDFPAFRAEVKAKLSEYLIDRGGTLVLPIVGEEFGGTVAEMRHRSREALAEGRRRTLVEGLSGTEDRVRAWLESIHFTLQPEPWNKADHSAMSVLATFPEDSRSDLAGYLRRDIAAYLTPLAQEGTIFEAQLFHLDEESLELSIRAAKRGT